MVGLGSTAQEAAMSLVLWSTNSAILYRGQWWEIQNNPNTKAYTNRQGVFEISADVNDRLVIDAPDQSKKTVSLSGGKTGEGSDGLCFAASEYRLRHHATVGESTMSVASALQILISITALPRTSAIPLFGNVLGLTTLQRLSDYSSYDPLSMCVDFRPWAVALRWYWSTVWNAIFHIITPEEVENVIVLKDAAAVAFMVIKVQTVQSTS